MVRRIAAALLLAFGCGRFGFEAVDEAPPPTADAAIAAIADAPQAANSERLITVGIQGFTGSYLASFLWTPGSEVPAILAGDILRLDTLRGADLRGMTTTPDGTLLATSGFEPDGVFVSSDPLAELSPVNVTIGTIQEELRNAHGVCTLPSGNVILGEFSTMDGNAVNEYTISGTALTLARSVYRTTVGRGVLSKCLARSDEEIYATDVDATQDSDADLIRLTKSNGVWTVASRFDLSEFAINKYGVHGTAIFSFALADDTIYGFPIRRHTTRIPNLLRCNLPALDGCVELGELPPDLEPDTDDPDLIQGAAAVPNSDQLLFVTSRALYRYDLTLDRYFELYDLSTNLDLVDVDGAADSIRVLRHVVVGAPR